MFMSLSDMFVEIYNISTGSNHNINHNHKIYQKE